MRNIAWNERENLQGFKYHLSICSIHFSTPTFGLPAAERLLTFGVYAKIYLILIHLKNIAAAMIRRSKSAATQAKRSETMKVNIVSFEPGITSKLLREEMMSWYARLAIVHLHVPHVRIKYQLCGYIVSAVNLILM